jgi:GTPase Era involved in 16S rRNA processing
MLNTIDEIKKILEKNEYRKKRYNKDIEWFEERRGIFKNNIIRVAIMGVTSSGKSTLVNALLGEKILPMAIRPSSSIIITASKGELREAAIYFKDKEPQILKEDNLNEDTISKYADENKNPNNELNVTQIHITTPNFILGENIHIIDSPGLDAWNLENHEKLTLEILLPTIDICIFVTTVKANSDGTNAEKIKIVDEKEKQVILVQNMIDSVEEKIGKNGIVEEDKSTILKKHKKRAENLLKEATQGKDNFEVIQISALNGLNGILGEDEELYKKSNIEAFINAVDACTEKTIPQIDKQRAISISDKINNIITTDKEIIKGNELETIEALINVKIRDIDELVEAFQNAQKKIVLEIETIEGVISDTISEITASTSEKFEDYLSIVDKINNRKLYIESDILNIVKQCEKNKEKIYKKLNLDIRFSYALPSIESKNIEIKHKYEERTMLFKKEGVLNKGKRLLSNLLYREWGYKEVGYDEKIVDKDATIQTARDICNQNKIRYVNILKEWSNQYNKSISIFYDEVRKRSEEYEEKKKQNIELFDIEDVSKSLAAVKDILGEFKIEEDKELAVTNDYYEQRVLYSISKGQYNCYMLSNKVLEQNYLLIGKYIRQKSIEKMKTDTLELFWTWDIDSCKEFIFRTYGVYIKAQECEVIQKEGIYSINNMVIVYELCQNKLEFYEKIKLIKGKIYNMFIIFNGIQIGNSKKQILESRVLSYFFKDNESIMVNLVIDSCREFINANNIGELLLEVESLKNNLKNRFYNVNIEYLLINSKNPIYNMALIEGQKKNEFIISDYKILKEKLFENPLSRGAEEKETLEAILNHFLNTTLGAR